MILYRLVRFYDAKVALKIVHLLATCFRESFHPAQALGIRLKSIIKTS